LDEWNSVKPDLLAGRDPGQKPASGHLTLAELVNAFLHHKKQLLDSGEVAAITWQGYAAVGSLLLEFFGRTRAAVQLHPMDFQRLRAHFAKGVGPVTLSNRINVVRMIFKYGYKSKLLTKEAEFGVEFEKPSAKTLRLERANKGARLFTPQQIKALIKAAEPHMKAMILLALNGGLGNNDLALLTLDSFDLKGGWLDYPRPKTGVPRRIPLWPETVAAVRVAAKKRRTAKAPEDAKLLFIGAHGSSYVSNTGGHRVAHEFASLRDAAHIKDRVFYDLRRTFQTVADNLSRDRDGVKAIMGHAPASGDMSAIYRQGFDDDRLRSVVDHVRGWLYAEKASAKRSPSPKNKPTAEPRTAKQEQTAALRIVG